MSHYIRSVQVKDPDIADGRVAEIAEMIPQAPQAVLAALYGAGAPSHVTLLVDAALRGEVVGLFDLDILDIGAICMFDGKAAEDYGEVAPWLVDLSIKDPSTQDLSFHQDFFQNHWGTGTSVIVQSAATRAEVRRHLRRFTKLPVADDGKPRFFRFWDGRVLPGFLHAIAEEANRARRIMMTDDAVPLRYLTPDGTGGATLFIADEDGLSGLEPAPMFLRWSDFEPLADAKRAERLDRMTQRIAADFAPELQGRPQAEVKKTVLDAVKRFEGFGFRSHAHLHFFATWSVLYGIGFEQNDSTGRLQEICRAQGPEANRFREFRKWFDRFKVET